MQWVDLLGHEQPKAWFMRALANGRLATSFLFVGPSGIGKRTFARLLAKGLLCRNSPPDSLEACGHCEDCTQVDATTHPDLITVSKPEDRAFIPVDMLIGQRESRMREGLCHDISLRPFSGRRKIAIVDDADYFNTEGANCLLKTLEEPPVDSLLILLGTSLQRQLPTIRSRCQAILFRPLALEQLHSLILRFGITDSPTRATELARAAGGSLSQAQLLADPTLAEFQEQLLHSLSEPRLPIAALVKECGAVADAAGKDPRLKRERLKLVMQQSASFYRLLALHLSYPAASSLAAGADAVERFSSEALQREVHKCGRHWKMGVAGATRAWNRCLLAAEQIDRNANQASLLEAWATDLATLGGC